MSSQQKIRDITWTYAFDRSEIKYTEMIQKSGVYLYILKGSERIPRRIIYVGTASQRGFFSRWLESAKAVRQGGGTIFRVADRIGDDYILREDIYDLMKYEPESYYQLNENKRMWLPGKKVGKYFENHYFKDIHFDQTQEWSNYVNKFHLKRSEIWYCEIEDEVESKILETQIQMTLGKKHALKYYKGKSQNWVGKQEIKDRSLMSSVKFIFNNYPSGLDNETESVLSNMLAFLE